MKLKLWMAFAALAAQAASAGVYVEMVDHDIKADRTSLAQKIYVQNGDGRFVDAEGHATLIKKGTFYIIDDQDKSYVMFDKATTEQLAKKISEAMEKMKAQLAQMPAEQRAQMEQMMPGLSGSDKKWTVEVAETGKTDKVDGRTCRLWDVTRGGKLDDQICVVPYSDLPGKENFQAMFANFAKVFEEMAKSVPMMAGMMTNEFSAQSKVNGFPVRSRGYEEGKLGDDEQIMKVWREETIPAATFEIPAGYKQKQMPMGPN